MLWKIDFRNLEEPPVGYIPGVSRGDPGFITSTENQKTMADQAKLEQLLKKERDAWNLLNKNPIDLGKN
jgi:hypothetical protein